MEDGEGALKEEDDACALPRVSFWGNSTPQGRYDVNDKAGEIKRKHEVSRPQGSEIRSFFDSKTQNSFDPNELKFVEIVEIIWWTYERIVFPYRSPSS